MTHKLNASLTDHLHNFAFAQLFNEMGWDNFSGGFAVTVAGRAFTLKGVAQKRGYQVFVCSPDDGGPIPEHPICRRIDTEVLKRGFLHVIVFVDGAKQNQKWFWVRRKKNQPAVTRSWSFNNQQSGELLARKLDALRFTLNEEETLNQLDVIQRMDDSLDVERVTKRFYDFFKKERDAFAKFLKGIDDAEDHSEYVSVMISRLMFLHFIQEKDLLAGDRKYLQNHFARSQKQGKDRFYRDFLRPLFFQGLATPEADRSDTVRQLLGKVPYLNGGLFAPREIEQDGDAITISDKAFESLLGFFGRYQWHLDDRPLKKDDEINPDILGYIFEKYINQKQMGAYYTKEDITGYISQNTILPFLLDAVARECPDAFAAGGPVWSLLADSPDDYLYDAVRQGVVDEQGNVIPLPAEISEGIGDVSKRGGWNRPATAPFALPTETWREHVARRQRCLDIRQKLAAGEIHSVNDLITFNLNVRQFVQDICESVAEPDLLTAFYGALSTVTILDPTCGSGAFLFAALNILEPLYEACIARMEAFVSGTIEAPTPTILSRMSPAMRELRKQLIATDGRTENDVRFRDFRRVLDGIKKHSHNRRYFIYKSIIVHNLYGVDLMEEATEICKLRLFLKLVSQVTPDPQKDNYGIEPLPDIDFNIKAGNTLVGYATWDQVHNALDYDSLDFERKSEVIKRKAAAIQSQIDNFQKAQLSDQYGTSHSLAARLKEALRSSLKDLRDDLDHALALQYGQTGDAKYEKWHKSHHPFHWCIEFPGTIQSGGFDVIVGNPPYVVYSPQVGYALLPAMFATIDTKNLYASCFERALSVARSSSPVGLIVQLTAISSERLAPLQNLLLRRGSVTAVSFPRRPESVFEGVEMPVVILLSTPAESPAYVTSRVNRFYTEERPFAMHVLHLAQHTVRLHGHRIAKFGSPFESAIFAKLARADLEVSSLAKPNGSGMVYYQEACRYWLKAMDRMPYFRRNGESIDPPHGRVIELRSKEDAYLVSSLANSSLFYWYYSAFSDCEHVNDALLRTMKLPSSLSSESWKTLGSRLDGALKSHAAKKTIRTKQGHHIEYEEMNAAKAKPIIDEIDRVLAKHYGFTDEELDFIINYDIKYRMGADDGEEDDQ